MDIPESCWAERRQIRVPARFLIDGSEAANRHTYKKLIQII